MAVVRKQLRKTQSRIDKMNEQSFWSALHDARYESRDDRHFRELLIKTLVRLSKSELFRFHELYLRFMDSADKWPLWDAIYLINGGCSDDSWFDFRDYLISRGRTVYQRIVSDPESLIDRLDKYNQWPFGEYHFHSAAENAYRIQKGSPDDCEISIPTKFKWTKTAGKRVDLENNAEIKKHFPRIWEWQNKTQKTG